MDKPKISIVAVNWWAEPFAKLLVEKAYKLAKDASNFEIIIIDNSKSIDQAEFTEWAQKGGYDAIINVPESNIGHGNGLDMAINELATGDYILTLDIDSHIIMQNWDEVILQYYQDINDHDPDGKCKLIAGEGSKLKPARPCVMFFERSFFIDNNMSFVAQECNGVKFDVGVHFYFKTLSLGYKVDVFKYQKATYNDVFGNNFTISDSLPFVYHNWYATRWYNVDGKRVHDKIDSVDWPSFEKKVQNLFDQV